MNKIIALLLTALILVSMCGCGESKNAKEVDSLIGALGEIDVNSGEAISQIEEAIKGLTDAEISELKKYSEFKKAKRSYDALVQAEAARSEREAKAEAARIEKEEKIAKVDGLIAAIGKVNNESDAAIKAARKAYDELKDEQKAEVGSYQTLTEAEKQLPIEHVKHFDDSVENFGTVSLDSVKALEALEKDYKKLTDEEKNAASQKGKLEQLWDEYYKLYARSLIHVTYVGLSSPDSAGGLELYFNFINEADRTIKYLKFGVTFYNRVNDIVTCNYKNDIINRCSFTGPTEKGQGLTGTYWHWGDYYNWDIDRVELVELSIEYVDGGVVNFNEQMVRYAQY